MERLGEIEVRLRDIVTLEQELAALHTQHAAPSQPRQASENL
jgi:hypothetical protein